MASSVPAFGIPYFICKQDCYLQLDDQCMNDCVNEHAKTTLTMKTEEPKTVVWPYFAGSGILIVVGLSFAYYAVKH